MPPLYEQSAGGSRSRRTPDAHDSPGAVAEPGRAADAARRVDGVAPGLARAVSLLERAADSGVSVERRLRFLALSGRCLDTVFESADPRRPVRHAAFAATGVDLRALVVRQEEVLSKDLVPALENAGVEVCTWAQLPERDRNALVAAFDERIFPVLTPLRLGPAHPLLLLASLVTQVGVVASDEESGERFFARLELPRFLPCFVRVPGRHRRLISLEELISTRVERLFPGATIESAGAFRVTRSRRSASPSAGVGASGPLPPRGAAVRLECDSGLVPAAQRLLRKSLELEEDEVFARRTPLDLGALDALCEDRA